MSLLRRTVEMCLPSTPEQRMFTPNVSRAAFRGGYMFRKVVKVRGQEYPTIGKSMPEGTVELHKASFFNPDNIFKLGAKVCDSVYDDPDIFYNPIKIEEELNTPAAIERIQKVEDIARGIKLAAAATLVVAGLVRGHTAGVPQT